MKEEEENGKNNQQRERGKKDKDKRNEGNRKGHSRQNHETIIKAIYDHNTRSHTPYS